MVFCENRNCGIYATFKSTRMHSCTICFKIMFTGRKKQDFFYYENRTEEEKPLQFLDFFILVLFVFNFKYGCREYNLFISTFNKLTFAYFQ